MPCVVNSKVSVLEISYVSSCFDMRTNYVFSHNGAYVAISVKNITLPASNGVIPPQKRNRETYGYKP